MGRHLPWLCLLIASSVWADDRVATARRARTADVRALISEAGLKKPPEEIYLRAFKEEKLLELWGGPRGQPLTLIKRYPICAASGTSGPKRKEGDEQVPEGFYEVDGFNPTSNFHLSMKVSYPNASDRVLSDQQSPGGLIYLHGGCASIGCIAITDPAIEEVYLLASDATARPTHIDIFPRRLDVAAVAVLKRSADDDFWRQLAPGYQSFERDHRPPSVKVDAKTGAYQLAKTR